MPKSHLFCCLVGLIVGLGAPAATAASAQGTPYSRLYAALAAARAYEDSPHLVAVQRIESKLPDVNPIDIRVVIRARRGDIVVPIGTDGRARFPLRDDLLREDPIVESNQPRGSLTLSITLALKSPRSTRIDARTLRAALDEVGTHLVRDPALAGAIGTDPRGIEFRFPPGSNASLTVRGDSERFLIADAEGRIVVMRDPDLVSAQQIDLSQLPTEVLPWMGNR